MTTTTQTKLSDLAASAAATGAWWDEGALDKPNVLVLPTRVLVILGNAGITTIEALKGRRPGQLSASCRISASRRSPRSSDLLRELDRQKGGGRNGHEQGNTTLR